MQLPSAVQTKDSDLIGMVVQRSVPREQSKVARGLLQTGSMKNRGATSCSGELGPEREYGLHHPPYVFSEFWGRLCSHWSLWEKEGTPSFLKTKIRPYNRNDELVGTVAAYTGAAQVQPVNVPAWIRKGLGRPQSLAEELSAVNGC